MILKKLILEKLSGKYENFGSYCQKYRKNFVSDLNAEDFEKYRKEYFASAEEVENLKNIIGFDRNNSQQGNSEPNDALRKYFNIVDVSPYKNIPISEIKFDINVSRLLRANGCENLGDVLESSMKVLFNLKTNSNIFFKNFVETMEKFFAEQNSSQVFPKNKILAEKIKSLPEEIQNKKSLRFLKSLI